MNHEILTGHQARKKYRLKDLIGRQVVTLTGSKIDEVWLELEIATITLGRDGEIAFFIQSPRNGEIGIFDNEQFCLLGEK